MGRAGCKGRQERSRHDGAGAVGRRSGFLGRAGPVGCAGTAGTPVAVLVSGGVSGPREMSAMQELKRQCIPGVDKLQDKGKVQAVVFNDRAVERKSFVPALVQGKQTRDPNSASTRMEPENAPSGVREPISRGFVQDAVEPRIGVERQHGHVRVGDPELPDVCCELRVVLLDVRSKECLVGWLADVGGLALPGRDGDEEVRAAQVVIIGGLLAKRRLKYEISGRILREEEKWDTRRR